MHLKTVICRTCQLPKIQNGLRIIRTISTVCPTDIVWVNLAKNRNAAQCSPPSTKTQTTAQRKKAQLCVKIAMVVEIIIQTQFVSCFVHLMIQHKFPPGFKWGHHTHKPGLQLSHSQAPWPWAPGYNSCRALMPHFSNGDKKNYLIVLFQGLKEIKVGQVPYTWEAIGKS